MIYTPAIVCLMFALVFAKHLIFDFITQGPYQYKNKGTYGHPGGILHSAAQAVGSFIVLFNFATLPVLSGLCILEFLIHYHIDWAKMNINAHLNLTPTNSEYFWWLLGFDQFLHYMTYVAMIAFIV